MLILIINVLYLGHPRGLGKCCKASCSGHNIENDWLVLFRHASKTIRTTKTAKPKQKPRAWTEVITASTCWSAVPFWSRDIVAAPFRQVFQLISKLVLYTIGPRQEWLVGNWIPILKQPQRRVPHLQQEQEQYLVVLYKTRKVQFMIQSVQTQIMKISWKWWAVYCRLERQERWQGSEDWIYNQTVTNNRVPGVSFRPALYITKSKIMM